MTNVVLARIDDRFIHGQVTVGWGQALRPDHLVLANTEIAADPWQSRVYASSAPPSLGVSVLTPQDAAANLRDDDGALGRARRVIVITGSPADMLAIVDGGVALTRVNIGGMHFAPGKQEIVPSVWVDRNDLAALRLLRTREIALNVQSLPGAREVWLDDGHFAAMEERL